MRTFTSPEHKYKRAVLVCYKSQRRNGFQPAVAIDRAVAQANRLLASFAVMEASDYKVNPFQVASQSFFAAGA